MTTVTQLPAAVSDADVDSARKALEGNGRAFDEPGVLDGTESSQAEMEENEKVQVQKIEGDNLPEVPKPGLEINKFIMDKKAAMDEINQERAKLNADASLIREELKSEGIDVATFEYQCKLIDMDEDKRLRVDQTSRLVRAAAGKNIQDDLFTSTETKH